MLIDKPAGWTSHDAVAAVRRQLGTRNVGHTGTLDPFASGLLVMLTGRATRLARFVTAMRKQYRAVIRFGVTTDTLDSTGSVTSTAVPATWPELAAIEEVARGFVGTRLQVPPAWSAKHVGGIRSYQLARRGVEVALPAVPVEVHRLDVVSWSPPDLVIDAVVGGGTYLRALARDLGVAIGLPAHCAELRRVAVGSYRAIDAVLPTAAAAGATIAPASLLDGLPVEVVDDVAAQALRYGRAIPQREPQHAFGRLLAADERLIAVGEGRDGWWHPVVVLEDPPGGGGGGGRACTTRS